MSRFIVFFGGRISHPSLVLIFSINISLCVPYQKKNVKIYGSNDGKRRHSTAAPQEIFLLS